MHGSSGAAERSFVAESREMRAVLRQVAAVAALEDVPVLVSGESGTGKELIARRLHDRSARRLRSFVALNSAAVPDTLLEAELFGHARGAFTGATGARTGILEEAHRGTLFLDEVADLSPRGQAILLRAIQEKEYRRLGETSLRRADFRLVAATHKDLEGEVASGRFRQDLYFRLNVVSIALPPLRERRSDILPLARHYLEHHTGRLSVETPDIPVATERCLLGYGWPGNVRELENEMLKALIRLETGRSLEPHHLSPRLQRIERLDLGSAATSYERKLVSEALARTGGNRTRAARVLGLSRQGLYRKLKRLGLSASRGRSPGDSGTGSIDAVRTAVPNTEKDPGARLPPNTAPTT